MVTHTNSTGHGRRRIPRRPLLTAVLILFVLAGLWSFLWPGKLITPVAGATARDWHPQSYWHPNWGQSVVHKGIDIFASRGTPVVAAGPGMVLYAGQWGAGGNVVVALGPDLCLHYYAHLEAIRTQAGSMVARGEVLGTVGNTGNAVSTPPHLHYAIMTMVPRPWRWDDSGQGWRKMFYLNPAAELYG